VEITKPTVLVVDSESRQTKELITFLETNGFRAIWARDGEAAFNVLDSEHVDALITELRVHRIDGMKLLQIAKQRNPEICAIMVTESGDIELATEAMRQGAYDFQAKPLNLDKIKAVLERGLSHQRLVLRVSDLEKRLDERYGFHNIIGQSAAMKSVFEKIRQIAPTKATVLIHGETGTGKELVAQAIHQNSPRKDGPFVKLNCAALAEGIIESELFGHEKGAFTGAVKSRRGRFELADGGTLFLDEIGEISLPVQAKLLRVLETQEFERVGGTETIKVDVRLIAATNKDLAVEVEKGNFREDLYYRLKVIEIYLPPLRDRREDIPLLVDAFIREFSNMHGKKVRGITRGAMNLMMQYEWPGNVRELKNCVEGMVIFAGEKEVLDVSDLPEHIRTPKLPGGQMPVYVGMSLEEIEKVAIEETLKACGYDKKRAAEVLSIGLRTLYRKQKEYGIY